MGKTMTILISPFVVAFMVGCKANQNKPDCDSWRDRLVDLVQQGSLKSDTIKFQRALALSDSVLSVDTTADNRRFCYYNRSIILNSLGRTEEGWKNKELEMLTLPENNLERLLFMAIKNEEEHKKDSAEFFLDKALSVCECMLEKEFDENVVVYKVRALYIRLGEKSAKCYLNSQVAKHPESEVLRWINDNWEGYTDGYAKFI